MTRAVSGALAGALAAGMAAALVGSAAAAPAVSVRPASASAAVRPAAVHPATGGVSPHVIVLGVRGARWDTFDGPSSAGVAGLSLASSLADVSMRSAAAHTCPADAWLTIGTGTRAAHPDGCSAQVTVTPSGEVSGFDALAAANRAGPYAAVVGQLADALATHDVCVTAVGPLAALGGAHSDGRVDNYIPDASRLIATDLLSCGVTLIDVPALPAGDAVVRAVLDAAVGDPTLGTAARLLLVGTGDGSDRLGAAAFLGAPFAPGLMSAPEVGRVPYVQLVDVPATILSVFPGVAKPSAFIGQAAAVADVSRPFPERLHAVRDAAAATQTRATTFPVFVALLLGLQAAGWCLLWLLWRRVTNPVRRRDLALAAGGLGLAGVAAPSASFLASLTRWQTSDVPLPLLAGATLAAAMVFAAAAARARRRSPVAPVAAICAVAALILAFDVVYSSRLQFNAVLGYDAITAGRFTGLGNLASGIFCALALLGISVVAARQPSPRRRLVATGVGGLVAVAIVGAPTWGADLGGVLALFPALVVLALRIARRKVTVAKLAAGAAALSGLVVLIGLLDAARKPDKRTHLGRFVASLGDGTGGVTIRRRLAADADLLSRPLSIVLILVCVAGVLIALHRPPSGLRVLAGRHPEMRSSLVAITIAAVIGVLANDSGASYLAGLALVTAPALGAATAYLWLVGDDERRGIAALSDPLLL